MQMREGTVVLWHVRPGERVEKGRPLLVIESDKAEVDVESPASGVLRHVYVEPGATVPCGGVLAALTEGPDEAFDADAFRAAHGPTLPARPAATAAPRAGAAAAPEKPADAAAFHPGHGGAAPVTPAARVRARELGLDLAAAGSALVGTGPGGRVLREDVEALAERLSRGVEVAPGVRLEVVEAGRGEPLLVLPGFASDAASFARVAPALGERFRVRIAQPRGIGAFPAPAGSRHSVAEAAADAAALTEECGAHVIGVSLGAAVALELALARPERVRSLVLVTPVMAPRPRLVAVLAAWARLAAESTPEAAAAALLPWLFSEGALAQRDVHARALRGLADSLARLGPAGCAALAATAAALPNWSPPTPEALRAVGAPTLVIEAGEDLLTGSASALASAIPGATHVRIDGAGHALLLEAPDAALAAIDAHRQRLGRATEGDRRDPAPVAARGSRDAVQGRETSGRNGDTKSGGST